MKNIIDYLQERKNISFADDPFNEVDGLVLSELVYTDFGGVLDENSRMDIEEANEAFWAIHTDEEILTSVSHTKLAPFLMREMAGSARFGGAKLKNYVTDISLKSVKQFGAITIELPDGTDFISYRGTNGTVAGWMEDFKFSFSTTEGQDDAVNYINLYHIDSTKFLRIGGHSKGGNLAVYAAVFCEKSIQNRISRIFCYDGPGFKMNILDSEEYNRILPRVLAVVPKECMVGIMMNNRYRTIVTDSDAKSMYQHDAYKWHIDGNRFEEVPERTEFSFFFERSLNKWLERCDAEQREKILDIFFTQIMNSDFSGDDSIKLDREFYHNLITNSPKLSHGDKAVLLSSLSDVFVSATSVTAGDIMEKLPEVAEKLKEKSEIIKEELKEKSAERADEFSVKSELLKEELKAESAVIAEEVKEKSAVILENMKEKSAVMAEALAERLEERKKNSAENESADESEGK